MNNDLAVKVRLLDKSLEEGNLSNTFEKIQDDEVCGYRALQNMKNGTAILLIILDESVYTSASITFGNLDDLGKKEKILRLFNDLNGTYKSFRFRIDENNDLTAEFCYIAEPDNFNANLLLNILINLYKAIQDEEYAKVMRVLWG